MRNQHGEIVAPFRAVLLVAAAFLGATVPLRAINAASDSPTATDSIIIAGSVSHSTVQNTVINNQDPAVLAAMAKTFSDQMAATTEARAKADAKAESWRRSSASPRLPSLSFLELSVKGISRKRKSQPGWPRSQPISRRPKTSCRGAPDDLHAAELALFGAECARRRQVG